MSIGCKYIYNPPIYQLQQLQIVTHLMWMWYPFQGEIKQLICFCFLPYFDFFLHIYLIKKIKEIKMDLATWAYGGFFAYFITQAICSHNLWTAKSFTSKKQNGSHNARNVTPSMSIVKAFYLFHFGSLFVVFPHIICAQLRSQLLSSLVFNWYN